MSCVAWCNYTGELRPTKEPGSSLVQWEIVLATFSNWFRNELLGIFEGETPTIPTQFYIACNTTASTAAAQGTELTGDNYSRSSITFERVSDIQRWNPADIYSPIATADWDEILSFSLHDAPTGGNYYAFGNTGAPVSIVSGKAVLWPANGVVVGLGSL